MSADVAAAGSDVSDLRLEPFARCRETHDDDDDDNARHRVRIHSIIVFCLFADHITLSS